MPKEQRGMAKFRYVKLKKVGTQVWHCTLTRIKVTQFTVIDKN